MDRVFLDEMTWQEASAAIERGAPAFLPTGPVEIHGPHIPMGCDFYQASGFAVALARKCGGIVLPPLTYNFSGATSSFQGTISVPIDIQVEMLKAIIRSLWSQGYRCIFILSVHGPNTLPIGTAVRTLFEEEGIPAVFLKPREFVDDEKLGHQVPNYDSHYREAMLAYAGARILGKERAIPDLSVLEDREAPPEAVLPESLRAIQKYGTVGYHYTHELQHIPTRANIDVDLGVQAMEEAAEKMLPVVEALREYVKWLQDNSHHLISNSG